MNCSELEVRIAEAAKQGTRVCQTRGGCRIELPLLEPNGDPISVFVSESSGNLLIHDGGHINGILFEAGPRGGSSADRKAVTSLVKTNGFTEDVNRGLIFVHTGVEQLSYWIYELARVIAVVSSTIPTSPPRARSPRRLGPRVAKALNQRLVDEGLMRVIYPAMNVKGVSEREFRVDFRYTVPRTSIRDEMTVFIFTADLDVKDPMRVANRSLVTAVEISSIEDSPTVRIVYGKGDANGVAEPAVRLIRAAGERGNLFENYCWDDTTERNQLVKTIGLEVSTLLEDIPE